MAGVLCLLVLVLFSPVVISEEYQASESQTIVVLTFDDGRKNWLSNIMPVLERYGLTATGFINSPDFLGDFTWDDVRELHNAGWEIGWHTGCHLDLSKESASAISRDFDTVKALFNEHGLPAPVTFAYPWGKFNHESKAIVAEYFQAARTLLQGVNSPGCIRRSQYRLKSFKLQGGITFVESKIKDYIGQGVLLIFMGHAVGTVDVQEFEITDEEFETLARFLHEKRENGEIDVASFSEGVRRVGEREETSSWRFKVESPFEPWGKAYGIPIPNRFRQIYELAQRD